MKEIKIKIEKKMCKSNFVLPLGGIEQGTLKGLGSVCEGDDDDVGQGGLEDGDGDLVAPRDVGQGGRSLLVRHIGSLELLLLSTTMCGGPSG